MLPEILSRNVRINEKINQEILIFIGIYKMMLEKETYTNNFEFHIELIFVFYSGFRNCNLQNRFMTSLLLMSAQGMIHKF